MELLLKRRFRGDKYTIGTLYINGVPFCDTLEDRDRGLINDMPLSEIKRLKIGGKTAIPIGRYAITLGIKSPKFSSRKQYAFCNGYLPRLLNVKGYEGVLIHIGNTENDTEGCLLVGENKVKGKVINSTATFNRLYSVLKEAYDNKEEIHITIQ